jgi:predicted nucleic acid-binding protein
VHLVDTNVISELMRPRPLPKVVAWFESLDAAGVSVVTVEEIAFGLVLRPNARMERAFERFLGMCSVWPVSEAIARRSATMRGLQRARGHVRHQADMLIAATAAEHGVTLATRNVRDFEGCGIRVVDPFR